MPVGEATGLLAGVVDGIEDRHHPLQIGHPGRGQFDLAGAPDQQGDPEFALELADLLGQRWLGDV